MAAPQKFSRSPIQEALVDIRVAVTADEAKLKAVSEAFSSDYPKVKVGQTTNLQIRDGKIVPALSQVSFNGIRRESEDGTKIVQFRRDGFTFNNLRPRSEE